MTIDVLEHRPEPLYQFLGIVDHPGECPALLARPALLAGEERDEPDPCIFRGTD
ncbi:hypothetical protein AB0C68_38975 [Streptomyces tendae]|uniref:hypothetical protein n=1 Tax=Streptomyces tendae TaxID=1932 RepID=UPI003408476D